MYEPQIGRTTCFECGQVHPATYSHEGRFGEGPIFAVVCDDDGLTAYYTLDAVELDEPLFRERQTSTTVAAALGIELSETGSATERVVCSVLLVFSAVVFVFVLLSWVAAGRADATRVIPGSGWQRIDYCDNRAGVQTILDVTTGHRFRVVHVTPDGRRVCRKVAR